MKTATHIPASILNNAEYLYKNGYSEAYINAALMSMAGSSAQIVKDAINHVKIVFN